MYLGDETRRANGPQIGYSVRQPGDGKDTVYDWSLRAYMHSDLVRPVSQKFTIIKNSKK